MGPRWTCFEKARSGRTFPQRNNQTAWLITDGRNMTAHDGEGREYDWRGRVETDWGRLWKPRQEWFRFDVERNGGHGQILSRKPCGKSHLIGMNLPVVYSMGWQGEAWVQDARYRAREVRVGCVNQQEIRCVGVEVKGEVESQRSQGSKWMSLKTVIPWQWQMVKMRLTILEGKAKRIEAFMFLFLKIIL